MAQAPRGKSPLDVLQSMVNGILIETGKALRASNKESGKSLANVNARLRTTIPSTIEIFHQALDDLECDIVRAKSVLMRDLEEMRAKRYALENPTPVIEVVEPALDDTDLANWAMDSEIESKEVPTSPEETVKQEDRLSRSPEKQPPNAAGQPSQSTDSTKDTQSTAPESANANAQGLTPPNSVGSKAIGLGINTEIAAAESAVATAEQQDTSLDSLFDADDGGVDSVNFDGMDFLTQSNDQSQGQMDDFDLANFGSTSQDFNMTDLHTSTQASNANIDSINKQEINEDIFSMGNDQSVDNMDLDFDLGVEDTSFNDMFDTGNELNHDLDSSFFES